MEKSIQERISANLAAIRDGSIETLRAYAAMLGVSDLASARASLRRLHPATPTVVVFARTHARAAYGARLHGMLLPPFTDAEREFGTKLKGWVDANRVRPTKRKRKVSARSVS